MGVVSEHASPCHSLGLQLPLKVLISVYVSICVIVLLLKNEINV